MPNQNHIRRILLIGATGFVGNHIAEALSTDFELVLTSRQTLKGEKNIIYFDLNNSATWNYLVEEPFDLIINASGYGVVKEETNLELMYDINYRSIQKLILFLQSQQILPFWLQVGSAFEYDLDLPELTEESICLPKTHYGISKYMASQFLLSSRNQLPFTILRPFAMYGPGEKETKIIPYLLLAQRNKQAVSLPNGLQVRDYLFVEDFASFIKSLLPESIFKLNGNIINVSNGQPTSLINLGKEVSKFVPEFDESLWKWGEIPTRENESSAFFNVSDKAKSLGYKTTSFEKAISKTISFYFK